LCNTKDIRFVTTLQKTVCNEKLSNGTGRLYPVGPDNNKIGR